MTLWEKQLEDDLDWRMAELASLKLQVLRETKGNLPYRSLLRALWAMLYAHYEGYCLFALNIYLEQLENCAIQRCDFRKELVVFSLEKEFRTLRGDTSAENSYKFFSSRMNELLKETISFEKNPKSSEYVLKGESNLYPRDLAANCHAVCLFLPSLETHRTKLWALVDRRNKIAHGEREVIDDINDYLPYEAAATLVMHELAYAILTAIAENGFLFPTMEYVL